MIMAILNLILCLGLLCYFLWATFKVFEQKREIEQLRGRIDEAQQETRLVTQWLYNGSSSSHK